MNRKTSEANSVNVLMPLLVEKREQITAFSKRRDDHIYKSIHSADLEIALADSWVVHKEGKTAVRVKKAKPHDQLLEDHTWCLFYRMGYSELNGDRFKISYRRQDGSEGSKQIDIFAKDDETVVVAECKSKESRGRRTLQKDLHETEALQRALTTAIRKHYGENFRPKILWLYVTKNIIWSEPDVDRASAINVRIITENEFQYFDSFIRHVGPAGRFQFLAEFLQGQDIPGLSNVKVPATKGILGGHRFYSFVTTPRTLLKIAFINHQALNHPDGRPAYQRMISPSRIREIDQFIRKGGYFPTNILINLSESCRFDLLPNKENADPNIKFGWLYLPNKYKTAWVIDGQHRLYGYSHLQGKELDQPIPVIAFEKLGVKDEAELFVTINQKQTRVQRSVIVSLQADLRIDSENPKEKSGAIASAIVKSLNSDPTSPFALRFSIHGVISAENQSLTIPEMVNGIIRSGLSGKVSTKGKNLVPGPLCAATDSETISRARRFLNAYFDALRSANTVRWEGARDSYISTNPSIRAHLLLVAETMRYLELRQGIDPSALDEDNLAKKVLQVVRPAFEFVRSASNEDIAEKFARKFGEGGVREYFENLVELILKTNEDFGSDELRQNIAARSDKRIAKANQDVIDINRHILDRVFQILKKAHGSHELKSGQKAYWEVGVENQKAKKDAYERQLQDTRETQPIEAYLNLLEIRDVIRQKNNWPHMQEFFNIPLQNEKGKTYYLEWLAKLNELRKIPAHPSGGRTYTEDDYTFLKFVKDEFYKRIGQILS